MIVILHLIGVVVVIVALERVDGLLAEPCCDILVSDLFVDVVVVVVDGGGGGDRDGGSGRSMSVDDHGCC